MFWFRAVSSWRIKVEVEYFCSNLSSVHPWDIWIFALKYVSSALAEVNFEFSRQISAKLNLICLNNFVKRQSYSTKMLEIWNARRINIRSESKQIKINHLAAKNKTKIPGIHAPLSYLQDQKLFPGSQTSFHSKLQSPHWIIWLIVSVVEVLVVLKVEFTLKNEIQGA